MNIDGSNKFTVPRRDAQELYVQIRHYERPGGMQDAQATWVDLDVEWAISYVDKS